MNPPIRSGRGRPKRDMGPSSGRRTGAAAEQFGKRAQVPVGRRIQRRCDNLAESRGNPGYRLGNRIHPGFGKSGLLQPPPQDGGDLFGGTRMFDQEG
jgi:hypothetical protein